MLDHVFFIGVAGTGMSALAQYLGMQGRTVCGSDRQFTSDKKLLVQEQLESQNVRCFPQDGSGLTPDLQYIVVSTAIEDSNLELIKAKELGMKVLHRSEALDMLAREKKCLAVAGTSGKSTTVGMLFHILNENGLKPSLITGAGLSTLEEQGLIGNALFQEGQHVVIEADESDGSLVRYEPDFGAILNIEKDHKEMDELLPLFQTFAKRSTYLVVNQDQELTRGLSPETHQQNFGVKNQCGYQGTEFQQSGATIQFVCQNVSFQVQAPGMHNMEKCPGCHSDGLLRRSDTCTICRGSKDLSRHF